MSLNRIAMGVGLEVSWPAILIFIYTGEDGEKDTVVGSQSIISITTSTDYLSLLCRPQPIPEILKGQPLFPMAARRKLCSESALIEPAPC